jgi:hypothetical protein
MIKTMRLKNVLVPILYALSLSGCASYVTHLTLDDLPNAPQIGAHSATLADLVGVWKIEDLAASAQPGYAASLNGDEPLSILGQKNNGARSPWAARCSYLIVNADSSVVVAKVNGMCPSSAKELLEMTESSPKMSIKSIPTPGAFVVRKAENDNYVWRALVSDQSATLRSLLGKNEINKNDVFLEQLRFSGSELIVTWRSILHPFV